MQTTTVKSYHGLAESIVDYRTQETQILGVPKDTFVNRIKHAFWNWLTLMTTPIWATWGIIVVWRITIGKPSWLPAGTADPGFGNFMWFCVWLWVGTAVVLALLSINQRWDKMTSKQMAIESGKGERNKIRITNIKTKELVLYNFKNIVLQYEASGDVSEQLAQVKILNEHPGSCLLNQCSLKEMKFVKNDPIWNAHFIFDKIPKNGELNIEYL